MRMNISLYLAFTLFLGLSTTSTLASSLLKRNSTGLTDDVTWDPFSLSLFGKRIFILSAEVHPFRIIPGANALYWRDIFQKIAANGFNTVSFYTSWATHFPTPDSSGDFEIGTYRDIQLFIDEAQKAGIWLIARPGPYINAETTGGGFPGWVGNIAGSLRTNNTNYTSTWVPYLAAISQIIAKSQITNGGPIILVQAENEFSESDTKSPYMQQIIDLYRDNEIVVPITHNDQHEGVTGVFSPDLPGTGRVNIYCGDSYPQRSTGWTNPHNVYWSGHQKVAPSNPLCMGEFGGGFVVGWGTGSRVGTGYEDYANNWANAEYENIFYKDAYAQTARIFNVYMVFGGTNWGQTATPVAYTSYDYGAGINENRVALPKMNEMRQQGLFLRVSRDLLGTTLLGNGTNYTTSLLFYTTELRNLDTQAGFYILRQNDSPSLATIDAQLSIETSQGELKIPQSGNITLDGRESKIIVTDYVFGKSQLSILYSTAEILTWTTIDDTDYIILYAKDGQKGETSFLFPSSPIVDTFNSTNIIFNYTEGILTLNYGLGEPEFAKVISDNANIGVIIVSKEAANSWHAPIIPAPDGEFGNFFSVGTNQSVLVSGPYLVRTARIDGNTLKLTGDLNGTTDVEIIGPSSISQFTWNEQKVSVESTPYGWYKGTVGENPPDISLPTLDGWVASGSLPEIDVDFDDSEFTLADQTTTNYTNLPPTSGDKVLYSQQYGIYGGNLIFRGHFNATGEETAISLAVQGGYGFGYTAWLNSVFLGSNGTSGTVSLASNTWNIPEGTLRVSQDNVLVVLMDHMGITENYISSGKEPRGIRGYSIVGGNTTFSSWRIQGNQGGAANTPDTFRGYLNEGGLYAERIGAHLPGFPDSDWLSSSPTDGLQKAGVNFYRTSFDLNMPDDYDVPIRLRIKPSDNTSRFRAQIYINGWQFGKYINDLGPQTDFVLPAGVLHQTSSNTLGISLWSLDENGASISGLELFKDGAFASALELSDYETSKYADQQRPSPAFYQLF